MVLPAVMYTYSMLFVLVLALVNALSVTAAPLDYLTPHRVNGDTWISNLAVSSEVLDINTRE